MNGLWWVVDLVLSAAVSGCETEKMMWFWWKWNDVLMKVEDHGRIGGLSGFG